MLSLLLLLGSIAGCDDQEDLDDVCQAFTELAAQAGLDDMSEGERMRFVHERVSDQLWRFSQTMVIWGNLPASEVTARYRMFKFSAEELLGHTWDCPAMERLAPTLGYVLPEPH